MPPSGHLEHIQFLEKLIWFRLPIWCIFVYDWIQNWYMDIMVTWRWYWRIQIQCSKLKNKITRVWKQCLTLVEKISHPARNPTLMVGIGSCDNVYIRFLVKFQAAVCKKSENPVMPRFSLHIFKMWGFPLKKPTTTLFNVVSPSGVWHELGMLTLNLNRFLEFRSLWKTTKISK